MNDDIICAIATSRLEAAISIIRISGKGCIDFVQSFFTGNLNKKSQTISYGYIVDGEEKITIEFFGNFIFFLLVKHTVSYTTASLHIMLFEFKVSTRLETILEPLIYNTFLFFKRGISSAANSFPCFSFPTNFIFPPRLLATLAV